MSSMCIDIAPGIWAVSFWAVFGTTRRTRRSCINCTLTGLGSEHQRREFPGTSHFAMIHLLCKFLTV